MAFPEDCFDEATLSGREFLDLAFQYGTHLL
jgi:hypothetical protein